MQRQVSLKIKRIEVKLFVLARGPHVMFLIPDDEVDGFKKGSVTGMIFPITPGF